MRKLSTIFLILTLIAGVGFFVYPDVASWWNGRIQSGILDTYVEDVAAMQQERIEYELQRAHDFNASIGEINISDPFAEVDALPEEYIHTLNVGGVMATIEVPSVNINMPVHHGTSSAVLDRAAGHLTGTSFPVGGEGTHAVITAHSGLSSARMFTDLLDNRVYIGDYFFINVLNQRLAYRVVQIDIVEPHEVELIRIYPGEDFVTLITCTPLAVNTHRLLLRGTRVPYQLNMAEAIEPVISVIETNWRLTTAFGAFLFFLLVFCIYQVVRIIRTRWKKKAIRVPAGVLAGAAAAQATPFDDDPYISIPGQHAPPQPTHTTRAPQHVYVYERATPLPERTQAPKRHKKQYSSAFRRYAMAGMAILMLLIGGSIALYPQIRRQMYDRYAENLIENWIENLDDSSHFIQQRWINEVTSFWTTVSSLPIASTNGVNGETATLTIGNHTLGYVSQLSVNSGGYLTLGGQPLGSNGYIRIADITIASNGFSGLAPVQAPGQDQDNQYDSYLYMAQNGDLYVNIGNGVYIGTNGGNVSMGNLSIGPSGGLYIGDTPIADLLAEDWNYEDFDLDFIFNFDLNQDPLYWLNNQMINHNNDLYENEQEALTDLESSEEVDFSVTQNAGISDEMLGFITIEAINIRIPIFAGASERNMLRGAGHMTHTSLPVGGPNTNAVITAHRGLTRARMFSDLDQLMNTNEIILITNPYQTLRYMVVGYEIVDHTIDFDDRGPILIHGDGTDMITLLTCHPYRVNTHRLLIFAVRVHD
ncbi:MAG: class C sortase [Defluviitaleaceae bacterium]|nr:class C sortase [Defluviitaleaceae bacterium]